MTEDNTFNKLRRVPYEDVRKALADKHDINWLSLTMDTLSREELDIVENVIGEYGWEFNDFTAELSDRTRIHLDNFIRRFKESHRK
jgi:hypothetical protein